MKVSYLNSKCLKQTFYLKLLLQDSGFHKHVHNYRADPVDHKIEITIIELISVAHLHIL